MSALDRWSGALRCPVCQQPLSLADRALRCPAGHTFDVARQGYVNLLGRAAPHNADTAAMVAARQRFLGAGWYAPIVEAVGRALEGRRRIVEVGAGTGHYLAAALSRPGAEDALGLATDVSVPASRRAARAHPQMAAVVADTWAGLPLLDGVADAVLCVFAPRNPDEFRRILVPGGRVVVVVPGPGHLLELRKAHGLLDIEEHKAQRIAEGLWHATVETRTFALRLDAQAATDLVGMGPNAFHRPGPVPAIDTHAEVQVVVGEI